jgi:hypothetical protein
MTDAPNNPPASPSADPEFGMTLRDWFAGQALAVLAHPDLMPEEEDMQRVAENIYKFADAMLAERAK